MPRMRLLNPFETHQKGLEDITVTNCLTSVWSNGSNMIT